MSAIAVLPADDGIVFAADAAAYDQDGNIIFFASKLYSSTVGRWGWGHVGIGSFGKFLAEAVTTVGLDDAPLDHLLGHVLALARGAYERAAAEWLHVFNASGAPRATMIIGGWSDAHQRFELYKLHSSEKEGVNQLTGESMIFPPWQLIPVEGMWASSMPRAADLPRFGIDWNNFDVLDLPARLVCALRASCDDRGDAVYGVGGRLEMMVINGAGVTRWVAHTWPDAIGEPIDPSVGEPMPAFPLAYPQAS